MILQLRIRSSSPLSSILSSMTPPMRILRTLFPFRSASARRLPVSSKIIILVISYTLHHPPDPFLDTSLLYATMISSSIPSIGISLSEGDIIPSKHSTHFIYRSYYRGDGLVSSFFPRRQGLIRRHTYPPRNPKTISCRARRLVRIDGN
jgi:hypothetical protein